MLKFEDQFRNKHVSKASFLSVFNDLRLDFFC